MSIQRREVEPVHGLRLVEQVGRLDELHVQLAVVRDVDGVFGHDISVLPVVQDGQEAFADDVAVEGLGHEDGGRGRPVLSPVDEVARGDGRRVVADGFDDGGEVVGGDDFMQHDGAQVAPSLHRKHLSRTQLCSHATQQPTACTYVYYDGIRGDDLGQRTVGGISPHLIVEHGYMIIGNDIGGQLCSFEVLRDGQDQDTPETAQTRPYFHHYCVNYLVCDHIFPNFMHTFFVCIFCFGVWRRRRQRGA